MDIWSWMCDLPNSDNWPESDSDSSSLVFQLTNTSTKSILLKAQKTSDSDPDPDPDNHHLVTFSICINGFHPFTPNEKTIWTSDSCNLKSDNPFLPFLLQLIHETIIRSPTTQSTAMISSICPRSQLQKLKPESISWIVESHSPESFSNFFNFIFLSHFFWICVSNAPSEVGFLYFQNLFTPNLNLLSCKHVLRNFLISIGIDGELCFMRTLGYMLAKWFIIRDTGVGLQLLTPLPSNGFSYTTESHGFWILRGYSPILSMNNPNSQSESTLLLSSKSKLNQLDTKGTVLKYALAHQQLEAVLQLEYSVYYNDGFIQVNARVDNLRFRVVKLGFNKEEEDNEYSEEKYFPSRVRVWVGPEAGSSYVSGLSLGRSTQNQERDVEIKKTVKGSSGKVKTTGKTSTKRSTRSWRFDQDAEGHVATFEAILCDNISGIEIAKWKPTSSEGNPKNGIKNRLNEVFNKTGGVVFAGEEYGEGVGWRLSREMEGSVLKWRFGGKVWVSYLPSCENTTSSNIETRCVEWCDEIDLPLIPGKYMPF